MVSPAYDPSCAGGWIRGAMGTTREGMARHGDACKASKYYGI